jgi:hypothetical protein
MLRPNEACHIFLPFFEIISPIVFIHSIVKPIQEFKKYSAAIINNFVA